MSWLNRNTMPSLAENQPSFAEPQPWIGILHPEIPDIRSLFQNWFSTLPARKAYSHRLLVILISVLTGSLSCVLLECLQKIEIIIKSWLHRNFTDRDIGGSQQLFCLGNAKVCQIMGKGCPRWLFEYLAYVVWIQIYYLRNILQGNIFTVINIDISDEQ